MTPLNFGYVVAMGVVVFLAIGFRIGREFQARKEFRDRYAVFLTKDEK